MNKTKPFLIIQLRPETAASDEEYAALLRRGNLDPNETVRVRLDRESLPTSISLDDFSAVIVGGGPGCVSDPPEKKTAIEARIESALLEFMPSITHNDFPFLGCCAGIGILGRHLGASVSKDNFSEPVGMSQCRLTDEGRRDPLLDGIPAKFPALIGHKEALDELPPETTHLVDSPMCPYQMIRYRQNVYATQFHPESDGHSFELRIKIYANYGYFDPLEADELIRRCHSVNSEDSGKILANFVRRYRAAR